MSEPDDLPPDLHRAVEAIDAAQFDVARSIAEQALQRGTDDVRYAFVFAQACIYQEDFGGLEAIADALLATAPDMVLAHIWKGDARRRKDDRRATLDHYETALANAGKLDEIPPGVAAALDRVKAELPTLRRQLGGKG